MSRTPSMSPPAAGQESPAPSCWCGCCGRAGGEAIERADDDEVARRHVALDASEGKYDGVYGEGYLAALRRDWPA